MKNLVNLALVAALFSGPVYADLSGDYLTSWWSLAENGGSVTVTDNPFGAPETITLVSNNNGSFGLNQDITIAAPTDITVTFDWSFNSADNSFGPLGAAFWDPFGYLVEGTFHRVSDNFGAAAQNGSVSFDVMHGEVFGFRARSIDGKGGAATTVVSNLSTTSVSAASVVPLPPAVWLMGAAISGLFMVRRRYLDGPKP